MNRLAGKVAIITGGNTGIGRAVARAYADEGADVAVAWIAEEPQARSLVSEFQKTGRRALAIKTDVTVERDVRALVSIVRETFGRIEILVNSIAPGLIDTGFDPLPDDVKRAHAASLPLKRLGMPEDLVGAFVFLASDESRYFCGQTLHPNGGEIMP